MSVRFDATSDRITYSASNPPDPSAGFTLTMWVRARVDTNNNATLARLHADAGGSTTATLATESDGLGGPSYFTGGGSVTNTVGLLVDVWRKVAYSASGTTGRVYVAPLVGATTLVSGTIGGAATPTGITLGGRSATDANEPFDGGLAYVRYWASQLTQVQIEAEWDAIEPVITAGLWADWPLEEHTDLTDHSGNGHHMVAGATALTTEDNPPLTDTITGVLAGSWAGTTGTLSGTRTVFGTLAGSWSGTTGTLTQAGAAVETSGGWETLTAISREARQMRAEDAARVPVACPNDGEPLRAAPDGGVYCPWDGWRPGF